MAAQSVRRTRPADRDRGLSLLLSFTGALLVMVADVVLIGALERSWALVPGFAVLVLMSVIVFAQIMRLLADAGDGSERDGH